MKDIRDAVLVDKYLAYGSDYQLDNTGDFVIVTNDNTHLQAAQNRCISMIDTWMYDDLFGNSLKDYLRENTPRQLTEDVARGYVQQALQPMLDDGRIQEISDVRILEYTDTSVAIEVRILLGVNKAIIAFDVTNF